MSWPKRLLNMLRRDRVSEEIDREMSFHVRERIDDLIASGLSEQEAISNAKRQFGNYTGQKEKTREIDLLGWLESVGQDVRYALRMMRASPGFTAVAILSLALGIGANTAIFSLIDTVLLRYLPVNHPEQLVQVKIAGFGGTHTNPIWEQLRDRQDVFSGFFAYGTERFNLSPGGEARYAPGDWVSGDYFNALGVRPFIGRTLMPQDDKRGCPAVAVLSYDFWQREYGGSTAVLGKNISLEAHPFEIVGVAQPGFSGVEVGRSTGLFVPICSEAVILGEASNLDHRSTWWLMIIGRPKPGVSPQQARARLNTLAPVVFRATLPPDWRADMQKSYLSAKFDLVPAANGFSGLRFQYRSALIALMVVVGVVLLIACANVANLLLARATVRQREFAVRLALGAGRWRLIRQLLTESLILSVGGAILGALFAQWSSRLLVGMLASRGVPVFLDLTLDGRILAFTMAIAAATALLFGVAPAIRSTRVQPHSAMKTNSRGTVEGRSRFNLGKALVIGQLALSLVLLVAAGLLLGTFLKLANMEPGFHQDHVLLMNVGLRNGHFPPEQRASLYSEILGKIRATPGVESASSSDVTPVSFSQWDQNVVVDGYAAKSLDDTDVFFNRVSDGFFETLGTPLLAGRDFNVHDETDATPVAIVNASMALKFFGKGSPLGKHFRVQEGNATGPPVEIVGLVGDARYLSLRDDIPPTAYLPFKRNDAKKALERGLSQNFEIRSGSGSDDIIPGLRSAVSQVNRGISVEFTPLSTQVAQSLSRERLLAMLSSFFGALALLLATIGLYGVMSYNVARRRGEIGIRMALGAERSKVVRMVLGETVLMVGIGLALGAAVALAAARLVQSFLFDMKPTDPATLAGALLILALAGAFAGYLPARRAARMDPMAALREE